MKSHIHRETIDLIVKRYQEQFQSAKDKDALLKEVLNEAYFAGRDQGTLSHPRYTRIDIEGKIKHYAIFERKEKASFINVQLLTPEIELESAVPAHDQEQQVIAAKHIYHALEGHTPTPLGIDLYMRPFEHITGNYNRGNEYEK